MSISAFGVEHGEEFSKKASPRKFNTSPGSDPEGYRQAVGNQANWRSAKFHREDSLGRRSKRIARESAKGYGMGTLKGMGVGAGAGATLGLVGGLAAQKAGAKGAALRGVASGAGVGLGTGMPIGGGLGGAKGMRKGRRQNINAGDTASYRRGGKHKSKRSKGPNIFGFERYR